MRAWYPAATDEELERIGAFVDLVLRVGPRAADRRSRRRRAGAAVRLRARRRPPARASRRPLERRRPRSRPRLQDELARGGHARGDRRRPTTGSSSSSTRWPASGPGWTRSRSSTTSSSVRTPSCRRRFVARRPGRARGRALGGDRPDRRGRLPSDAERVHLRRLPGARPRLRGPAAPVCAGPGGVRRGLETGSPDGVDRSDRDADRRQEHGQPDEGDGPEEQLTGVPPELRGQEARRRRREREARGCDGDDERGLAATKSATFQTSGPLKEKRPNGNTEATTASTKTQIVRRSNGSLRGLS